MNFKKLMVDGEDVEYAEFTSEEGAARRAGGGSRHDESDELDTSLAPGVV